MKNYSKPTCKVKNIIIESPVLAGSDPKIDEGATPDSGTTALTNDHRSSWGNLWGVED